VAAPSRTIPVPLKGADGAVVKVAQPPNRRSRSAHTQGALRDNKLNQPPRLLRWGLAPFYDVAATPPCKAREYRPQLRVYLYLMIILKCSLRQLGSQLSAVLPYTDIIVPMGVSGGQSQEEDFSSDPPQTKCLGQVQENGGKSKPVRS